MSKATEFSREGALNVLIERDGLVCQFPGCVRKGFDVDGDFELTIDHWMPQSKAREMEWTEEQIWHTDNLRIMHKKCNAAKGDRIPNPDGTLPPTANELLPLHQRRADKSNRVPVCETCMSGRLLLEGETCYDCGSGPQPSTLPAYQQVKPPDCDHSSLTCWMCYLGFVERRPAIELVTDVDGME